MEVRVLEFMIPSEEQLEAEEVTLRCAHNGNDAKYNGSFIVDGPWNDIVLEGEGLLEYDSGALVYKGDFKDCKFDGRGAETVKVGNLIYSYEGFYQDGRKHGKGKYTFADKGIYEGDFRNDQMDGKGVFILPNGERYSGDWKNDMMDGKGIYHYLNGDVLDCYWQNNMANGPGTLASGGILRQGFWKNGQEVNIGGYEIDSKGNIFEILRGNRMNGELRYWFLDGGRYEGSFSNGQRNGKGVHTFPNGERYSGDWKNDMMEGEGTFEDTNRDIFVGSWKNGKRNGRGELTFFNGDVTKGCWQNDIISLGTLTKYKTLLGRTLWRNGQEVASKEYKTDSEGNIFEILGANEIGEKLLKDDDEISGKFRCWYTDGDVYEGEYRNGKKDGKGVHTFPDGRKYDGGWKNDLRDGRGTEYSSSDGKGSVRSQRLEYLYSNGFPLEMVILANTSQRDDGDTSAPELEGTGRPLCKTKYHYGDKFKPLSSETIYNVYGENGTLERLIQVKYGKINELLNSRVSNLEELVTSGALEDVTENLTEDERVKTLAGIAEYIKKYLGQTLGEAITGSMEELSPGEYLELEYLIVLGTLLLHKPEELRRVRLADPIFSLREVGRSIYGDFKTFLGCFGFSGNNIGTCGQDFFVTIAHPIGIPHATAIMVDLKRIGKLIGEGTYIDSINEALLYVADSSRAVGVLKGTGLRVGFGGVDKNCRYINRSIQLWSSCWYYAAASTVTVARHPNFLRKVKDGTIRHYASGEEMGMNPGELPSEFETKLMWTLQAIADNSGIRLVRGRLVANQIINQNTRDRLDELWTGNNLLSIFKKRMEALISEEVKKSQIDSKKVHEYIGKEHMDKLSMRITKMKKEREKLEKKPGEDEKPDGEEDPEGGKMLLALDGMGHLYGYENRLKEALREVGAMTSAEKSQRRRKVK
ncbi:MAG: hypothetical protein LBU15_02605 [Rickettsiales bacterium]|nr:hypothetical protein [Rickettsiales bacterium]